MSKSTVISKEDLTALLQKGEKTAFETIYKLYYNKLIHISKNYLNSHHNAEEIVQNVFLKLWANIDHIDEINNINNYLFTLTRNSCFDFLKHQKVKSQYVALKSTKILMNHVQDDAASLLIENELSSRILEGIDLLPQKCKEIFVQSRFNGLKNEDIAALYSISRRTVEHHISKGLRHMRVYLQDYIVTIICLFSFFK